MHGWDLFSDSILRRFLRKGGNTSHTHDKLAFASLLSLLRDIADAMDNRGKRTAFHTLSQKFSPCASFAVRGSVLRRLNLQPISEVKSQPECMRLIFGAPGFICTREFLHLYSKLRKGSPRRTHSWLPKATRKLASRGSLRRSTM